MPKTTISCSFTNAIGVPLSGYVLVGLDSWLMKDAEAQSITNLTGRTEFVDGACDLLLETSDTEYVTYSFEVYYYDEVTTSDPETGEPIVTTSNFPLVPKFYARVPYSATPISFNLLAKQSGINRDNLDTALSAIARRLYNEDTFWYRLQQNLFVPRGAYSPTAWYSRGDIVSWDGGSYLYYFSERSQGVLPSTATHWQQIASRGDTGAGTTGNDSPYDAGWNGQTDAPSRNAVYDIVSQLALSSTVAGLAPLASPTFTGTPTAPTQALSDNSVKLATTQFVQGLIAVVTKALLPVGSVIEYAGTSAPTGFVLCDGRLLDRTAFAALFAILGTTYNTGGESGTQFRVPDMRGRVSVAPDNMGGTAASRIAAANALNIAGGAATVTLTESQMPSHNHAPAAGFTNFTGSTAVGGGTLAAGSNYGNFATTANTGGGLPHENCQPYVTINFIIYTGV